MPLLFHSGFTFTYAGLTYTKLDNSEWGFWRCLNAKYVVESCDLKTRALEYNLHLESDEKPEESWWGFRWTDEQVKNYYNL